MGTVYLAADAEGRLVALKQLHDHLAGDATFRARFRREAELSQQVDGQFAAQVVDVDFEAAPPWIATQYIAGPTLADYVATHGPLSGPALIGFAAAVAEALRGIHACGIVHRDLTPRNVLIAADGPRVVDFGIAGGECLTAITSTGQAFGTPGTVAPEVVRGGQATSAADVFAWGGLVCFAASGSGPYGTGTPDQLLYRMLHEPPRLPNFEPALQALVDQALSREPATRPSPESIVHALTAATEPRQHIAPPVTQLLTRGWDVAPDVTTLQIATQSRPRRRWPAVAAAAVLAAGLGVTIQALLGASEPGPPIPQEAAAADAQDDRPTPASSPNREMTPALPAASPVATATPAASIDLRVVNVDDLLPRLHAEMQRRVVDLGRRDVLVVFSRLDREASGEDELAVTVAALDKGEMVMVDQVDLGFCGYFDQIVHDDVNVSYVSCLSGASANVLWAVQVEDLELVIHPREGQQTGWGMSGWERVPVTGQPDTLLLYQETCMPNCAEGGVMTYTLEWNPIGVWDHTYCTYPDGEGWITDRVNASARLWLDGC